MTTQAEWHGTIHERELLLQVLRHNCDCTRGIMGVIVGTCAPHEALATDQRFIDGLLWGRHARQLLLTEEFFIAVHPN